MGKNSKNKVQDYTPYNSYSLFYNSSEKSKTDKKLKIDSKKGIYLDVGCGGNKQSSNYVGLDIRPLPGVDIVWDMEKTPYPIPSESCLTIIASHVVEHINPANFGMIRVFEEWWRIMKPNGRLMISVPYGLSKGFIQDPTHCNPCNEDTFTYFDPTHRNGLWVIYQTKPWKIICNAWNVEGTLEVVLEKMPVEDVVVKNNQIIVDAKWATVNTLYRNNDK